MFAFYIIRRNCWWLFHVKICMRVLLSLRIQFPWRKLVDVFFSFCWVWGCLVYDTFKVFYTWMGVVSDWKLYLYIWKGKAWSRWLVVSESTSGPLKSCFYRILYTRRVPQSFPERHAAYRSYLYRFCLVKSPKLRWALPFPPHENYTTWLLRWVFLVNVIII